MELSTTHKVIIMGLGVVLLAALITQVEDRGDPVLRRAGALDLAVLHGELVDREAPPWTLPLRDGGQLSLAELRGKVVFVNFWASWCSPCREEMPSMELLARKYAKEDFVMVAISQDDDPAALDTFLRNNMPGGPLSMKVVRDRGSIVAKSYGTELLPETYLVDRDGRIVARFVSKYDWGRPEVSRTLDRLLM